MDEAHVTVVANNSTDLNEIVILFIGDDCFELLQVESNCYRE